MKKSLLIALFAIAIGPAAIAHDSPEPHFTSDNGTSHPQTPYGTLYTDGYGSRDEYSTINTNSPCYHGNFGFDGAVNRYAGSQCQIVYTGQEYKQLRLGASPAGGSAWYGY